LTLFQGPLNSQARLFKSRHLRKQISPKVGVHRMLGCPSGENLGEVVGLEIMVIL